MAKTEETWMDGITTEMMEHICDDLCRHPDQLSAMELEDECAKCKMSRFVCDILNQYNKVNDFADSQCAKLMNEMHELKERDTAKKPTYEWDGYAPDGTFVWDEWLCPNCGTRYEVDYDEYDHCPNCGQRIDWSE
mgnify:FL=1